jgi:thiamine pyrophosphate-dependent acetolactate synthase large subunit-like protein
MPGTVAAVAGLQRSDLLIALGARFDDRVDRRAGNRAYVRVLFRRGGAGRVGQL